ncbi:MAG: hypothetical protein CMM30_06270 [Rhodospirillaceae bacterium]|nr:hypothetical protein [Rhodospirillaceae bacterium]
MTGGNAPSIWVRGKPPHLELINSKLAKTIFFIQPLNITRMHIQHPTYERFKGVKLPHPNFLILMFINTQPYDTHNTKLIYYR